MKVQVSQDFEAGDYRPFWTLRSPLPHFLLSEVIEQRMEQLLFMTPSRHQNKYYLAHYQVQLQQEVQPWLSVEHMFSVLSGNTFPHLSEAVLFSLFFSRRFVVVVVVVVAFYCFVLFLFCF